MSDMTTIKIATIHGDHDVDAHVFGDWAAHRTYDRRHGWSVTHVPSGRCLPDLVGPLNKREAQAVAEAIHKQCDGSAWVGVPRTDDEPELTPEMEREGVKVRDVALEALRSIDGVQHCQFPEPTR
jgi:hypothetical protein